MKFGVNYTPREGWFHSWLDFNPDSVRTDLETIALLGADHVRIFPLWPLLQPNRTLIRQQAIEDVVTTVSIAHECGLRSYVDVLQGHLSSFDFLPSWVQAWHQANIFADPRACAGEMELVTTLAQVLRETPGAAGLTLGNEIIQFAAHRHPFRHAITESQARTWLKVLLDAAHQAWPEGVHVHSHDDDIWFDSTHPFTPRSAVEIGAQTTVHSWVFGKIGPRFGKDAPELMWFSRYLCELAVGWASDPHRRVWLQEVGAPDNYVSLDRAGAFLANTIDTLMGAHGGGVSPHLDAITWWCSHDVPRSLADFPKVEYTLGLIDSKGDIKPIGEEFRRAQQQWGSVEAEPTVRSELRIAADAVTRDRTDTDHEFFDLWMEMSLSGDVPRIVVTQPRQESSKEK